MTSRKAVGLRAVRLAVVEVDEILEALENARIMSRLDGPHRQQLENAREQLARARERPVGKEVTISESTAVLLMQCIAVTQRWYQAMFDEFDDVEVN